MQKEVIDIGERKADPKLQALYDAGKNVYSFSKLSTIKNCPYEAYLSYVLHTKNRRQGVWAVLGGKLHDKLEAITNGEANKDELLPLVDQELEYLDMLGLEFPKDFKGEDSIRRNWATNMQHFCDTFKPLKGKYTTEELLLLKVDEDHYIQGYADLVKHNDDGTVSIFDWKTSSMYSTEDFKHAARQLVIYGLAKEAEGYQIKYLAWIFMKYIDATFIGKKRANAKKESVIKKTIERRKLASELRKYVEQDLRKFGYDEMESDMFLQEMMETNSLEGLPDEIRSRYKIQQCIKTTPFDEDAKEDAWSFIRETMEDFESRGEEEQNWEARSFTKKLGTGKVVEDTFYCNALCNFGNTCKYITIHNEQFREDNAIDDEIAEWF